MITRTTTALIEDLRDPANASAWEAFDARYRPVLEAFAARLGFRGDDAAEVAQQAISEFARAYAEGRYRRGEGRLSSWLIGIARNVGLGMIRKRGAGGMKKMGGDSLIVELADAPPDDERLTRIWAAERERAILGEAMRVLRESTRTDERTIRAFELFAIRGVPAEEVARQCGIEVDAVYVIKNRLTKRLREIVRELTDAYDEGE